MDDKELLEAAKKAPKYTYPCLGGPLSGQLAFGFGDRLNVPMPINERTIVCARRAARQHAYMHTKTLGEIFEYVLGPHPYFGIAWIAKGIKP